MKSQSIFSGKNKKSSNLSSAEFAQTMVKVKATNRVQISQNLLYRLIKTSFYPFVWVFPKSFQCAYFTTVN